MSDKPLCRTHHTDEDSEKWEVALSELTEAEDEHCESFEGAVCPLCFLELRDKYRRARRNVKVESKAGVRLRTENDRLNEVLSAVIEAVTALTGEDPMSLAEATYKSGFDTGIPREHIGKTGDLKNILPNLIAAAANKGPKT